jgi:hypothetical protein
MKKIFILFTVIFINNLLTSQEIFISDSLFWQNKQIFNYNENQLKNILYCSNCDNQASTDLPVYFYRIPINTNLDVKDLKFVNIKTEVINNEVINKGLNLDKISENIKINTWISIFRKQNYLNIEFIPLQRNSKTGQIEKIIYFELKGKYYEVPGFRNQSKSFASSSVMSYGKWYKIKIETSGIYKLTYSQLISMGFTSLNNIGIFGYGGMVDKVAGNHKYDDLPEIPIHFVDANSNGSFDNGDYILFWLDGPHSRKFGLDGKFSHEFHNYSDYAYYFVSDRGSLKQAQVQNQESSFDVSTNTYDDYVFLEKDSINIMKSGRNLFWREFDYYLTQNFNLNIPNTSTVDSATVTIVVAARSSFSSYFNFEINGELKPPVYINSVSGSTTDMYARYNTTKDFVIVPSSDNFTFRITYNKTAANSKAWLDYISVKLRRKLTISSGYVNFRDIKTVAGGQKTRFQISSANSKTIVWDITDRENVYKINGTLNGSTYNINVQTSNLREFVAFNYDNNFPSPIFNSENTGPVENQNLHAIQPVDVIIITHPLFLSQANQLKQLHQQFYGYSGVVVSTDKVFNEFSSGTPDVAAMRNFVKMLYDRAADPSKIPHSVVLFGDGSYDNKSSGISNFILTYQSESSLSPTSSFVSDDYYVHLDDGEGTLSGNHNMDMGVGRIPVKSVSEAQNYINKLIAYHSSAAFGNWKNNVLLIADDAENGETMHQNQSNSLSFQINNMAPVFNITNIYLDDYEQVSTVQGHRYPDVNLEINNQMNSGNLVVNWIGHGNEKTWAHEVVLTLSMIKSWKNSPKFPLFVTATCEFSPFDHHDIVSGGEEVLLNENGGGIGLFTTTRLAFATSNFNLSSKFYNRLFEIDPQGKLYPIGICIANAKNDQGPDSNKRVFNYLGDPAIRLSVPFLNVVTTKINDVDVSIFNDTLKAKQLISIEGEIRNPDGSLRSDFNGLIFPVVYDKKNTYQTRGNDGYQPLTYQARKNIIFKGAASVTEGKFKFSFIVPIDIAYFYDLGKISYYAHNQFDLEAHGYDESFIIGGTSNQDISDNKGPKIALFLNNEQFVPGGITDENPVLIAKLQDESGINTVGSGIGHDITLTIDGDTKNQIVLNNFYESEIDDFTSGTVTYPISILTPGPHTIKVKAWDVLNNSSESEIDFIVAKSSELVLEYILNYPNPFSTKTYFMFAHNQPNVPLDVLIQIFTVSGKHVKTLSATMISDGFNSEPIEWDGKDEYGDKIAKGVYIYKVKVKNPAGNVVEKFEKLVIIN